MEIKKFLVQKGVSQKVLACEFPKGKVDSNVLHKINHVDWKDGVAEKGVATYGLRHACEGIHLAVLSSSLLEFRGTDEAWSRVDPENIVSVINRLGLRVQQLSAAA